ncbi:MAG TPA: archaeosortase/exosortase family protein, partial [Burkholderiaceae bacterium]|nr:archaeosortase/exosortase family protein [Burkholderiaceae bacterium]
TFMLFLVPLPGALIDAVTGPLKTQISIIAEALLYYLGYPIARSGVTIVIGSYQLLVSDACSGLHSMFSLSALGLFYLHLMQHRNWLRNGLIVTSILPIAFAANVVRVILLVLVTYHLGDAAGRGFLHGFAGMMMFVAALCSLFLLDGLFGLLFRRNPRQAA